eukprot:COSAG06_NODE_63740_length_261_cov_0.956790_1_plen_62_part_10
MDQCGGGTVEVRRDPMMGRDGAQAVRVCVTMFTVLYGFGSTARGTHWKSSAQLIQRNQIIRL